MSLTRAQFRQWAEQAKDWPHPDRDLCIRMVEEHDPEAARLLGKMHDAAEALAAHFRGRMQ